MEARGLRDRPIFIGGAGRSGTTLLRVMLNAHPNLVGGPEFKVVPAIASTYRQLAALPPVMGNYHLTREAAASRFGELLLGLLEPLRAAAGEVRIVEKTPHNVLWMREIAEMIPGAQFLHIVRDGRDVSLSLVEVGWKGPGGEVVWFCRDLENAFRYWVSVVEAGLSAASASGLAGRVFTLRYEDLVRTPEAVLRRVVEFLGEPWSERMLHHAEVPRPGEVDESSTAQVARALYASSIGRWRRGTAAEAVGMYKRLGGELLRRLGYEQGPDW